LAKITLQKAIENLDAADNHGQSDWRDEAYECFRLYNGYQYPDADLAKMAKEARPSVALNHVGTVVDAMVGLELANRKEIKFYPRTVMPEAGIEADLMSSIATWIRQDSGQEVAEVDSEKDMFICGVGCTDTSMTYDDSELGDLSEERINPLNTRWDWSARKRNLTDARWVARYKRMDIEDIEATWPDADLGSLSSEDSDSEAKMVGVTPATYNRFKGQTEEDDRPKVWQYQYYSLEPYWKVDNPFLKVDQQFFQFIQPDLVKVFGDQISSKQLNLTEDGYSKLKKMAKELGITDYTAIRMNKKVFYRLIFVGSVVLHHDENPIQGHFTQKFITGKRDETDGCWYGIVRPMKDPQLWANKFLSTLLYIYMHNSKGGVFVESDAVPNHEDFRRDYAKPGTALIVNPGANSNGKIKERSPAPLDSAAASIMQMAVDAIPRVTGISPAVFAVATQNRSNALEETRIKQTATLLLDYFESMTQYRKDKGKMYIQFTKTYLCQEERLIRISGNDNSSQFIQLMSDKLADEYDVIAEEGAVTINQKAETWQILTQLFQGQGIPISLWKYAPIPTNIANEIMTELQNQQQAQAEQQQMMTQAQAEHLHAKAQKDMALAQNASARSNQVNVETAKSIVHPHIVNGKDTRPNMIAMMDESSPQQPDAGQGEQPPQGQEQPQQEPSLANVLTDNNRMLAAVLLTGIREQSKHLADAINRPKQVVRDQRGKVVGVQ